MRPLSFIAFLFISFLSAIPASAQTASDVNEGCRLTKDVATGAYSLAWWGKGARTYFVQHSDDLVTWTYLPLIESGVAAVTEYGFTSTAQKSFFRLRFSDAATGGNPDAADFDGDGLTNLQEIGVTSTHTDPLVSDTDGDGFNDGVEVQAGTDPMGATSSPLTLGQAALTNVTTLWQNYGTAVQSGTAGQQLSSYESAIGANASLGNFLAQITALMPGSPLLDALLAQFDNLSGSLPTAPSDYDPGSSLVQIWQHSGYVNLLFDSYSDPTTARLDLTSGGLPSEELTKVWQDNASPINDGLKRASLHAAAQWVTDQIDAVIKKIGPSYGPQPMEFEWGHPDLALWGPTGLVASEDHSEGGPYAYWKFYDVCSIRVEKATSRDRQFTFVVMKHEDAILPQYAESPQPVGTVTFRVGAGRTNVTVEKSAGVPFDWVHLSGGKLKIGHDEAEPWDLGPFKAEGYSLVPVEILEVAERDQIWNRVPNPKDPPSYRNAIGLEADLIRRVLFASIEPQSGNVELTVKTAPGIGGGSGPMLLCGIQDNSSPNSPILPGSVPVSPSGETQIDFTPTGDLHANEMLAHRVVLGIDKNSNGHLDLDEVDAKNSPLSQRFYVKAVTQSDYEDSVAYLDNREILALPFPVARSFLRYFDGKSSTISEATSLPALIVPITATANPTHIAGSTYDAANGDTSIPKFKMPEGSAASNKIENTLDRSDAVGLRTTIYNVWNANVVSLAAPFIADASLQTSSSGSIDIPVGTVISLKEPDDSVSDLGAAYGGANIHGTVSFGLKRDPANSLKVILTSVTINAVVEDMYDFDWTRDSGSQSRQAATVQIGWQPSARMGGKIFATETEVQRLYDNDSAISRFNSAWSITLPNPSPGTPIIPPQSDD